MPLSWRALLLLSFSSIAGTASAQDMVYTPINPSFGGNPFNSSHLIGIANAQNNFKDPKSTTSNSQADIFARQLQSRLLSALSSQITDQTFGENQQERGHICFGRQHRSEERTVGEGCVYTGKYLGVAVDAKQNKT